MKGKKLQGLMAAAGSGSDSGSTGAESEFLSRAFNAAKSGNEAQFKSSMLRAIRLCVQKELDKGYGVNEGNPGSEEY